MSCFKKEGAYFVPERVRLSVLADGSFLRADLIISGRYADYSEDWVIRFCCVELYTLLSSDREF